MSIEGKSAREIAKMITDGIIPPRHIGTKTPEVLQQELFALKNRYKPQTWLPKEQKEWKESFLDTMAGIEKLSGDKREKLLDDVHRMLHP